MEVGNVLSHYQPVQHEIVDKYELESNRENLIREDILTYSPSKAFDAIVSISTIEHVGKDEEVRQSELAIDAFERIPMLLTSKGTALVTFAAGYNIALDRAVHEISIQNHSRWKMFCLQRVARYEWRPVDLGKCLCASYGHPFPCGNVLVILEYTPQKSDDQLEGNVCESVFSASTTGDHRASVDPLLVVVNQS